MFLTGAGRGGGGGRPAHVSTGVTEEGGLGTCLVACNLRNGAPKKPAEEGRASHYYAEGGDTLGGCKAQDSETDERVAE